MNELADWQNSGNAVTDGFMEDVGITQSQYNVGQQLLFIGIVVLEVCVVTISRFSSVRTD